MKQIGGRCPALSVSGEIDVAGLQPTAARDALKASHSQIMNAIMLDVVKALFELLRKRGRDVGCVVVEGLDVPYRAMCRFWDADAIDFFLVTCEQRSDLGLQAEKIELRHIALKGTNGDQKLPEGHYFVPAELVYYCTKHEPLMTTIEKAHTLVRLDLIADKGFRVDVQKYLERRFSKHLEDITGWTYTNWYEPDDIDINMSERPEGDAAAVHWVHKKLRLLFQVFYRIQGSKFAFEIIETDSNTGLVAGAGGKYNPKNKLVIKINDASSAVLEVGKEAPKRDKGGAMIMLIDQLVSKDLQAKLANLGRKFEVTDLNPGMVFISVGAAEKINFGGGSGSWPGPGTNFMRLSGMQHGDGYYIRLPAEYDTKELCDMYGDAESGAQAGEEAESPEFKDEDDTSFAKVMVLTSDLTMFTSYHHCLGTLKPPGTSNTGAIEYKFTLLNKQKMLPLAAYRPPGSYNSSDGDGTFIKDISQGVLSWSTGTFLPVPLEVGEMLDDDTTDDIQFEAWVNYDKLHAKEAKEKEKREAEEQEKRKKAALEGPEFGSCNQGGVHNIYNHVHWCCSRGASGRPCKQSTTYCSKCRLCRDCLAAK
jgi:hypothetical protein